VSGTLTLLPTGNAVQVRGAWIASAGTLTTAVNDASDSTYVRLNSSYITYQYGASIWWPMAGQSLPPDARVYSAYSQVRAAKTVSPARAVATNLFESALTPGNRAKAQYLPRGWNAQAIGTTINDYKGRPATQTARGTLIDQTVINNLWVEGLYFTQTDTRIYEARAIINYDEKPTATILAPTGAITDEGSPLVVWDYLDDLQPQVKYQVQILDAGTGNVDYDSGIVTSSDGFHEVASTLGDKSFTIKLRVAQAWTGPGGDFWSDYIFGSFSLAVQKPSQPVLVVTKEDTNGRIKLDVSHNLNLMNYEQGSHEYGPNLIYSTAGFSTQVKSSVQKQNGAWSSLFTNSTAQTAGNASLMLLDPVKIEGGQTMSASMYMRSTTGSATWKCGIRFYDVAGALISTSYGTPQSVTSSAFQALDSGDIVAPANAVYATPRVENTTTAASGTGWYVDEWFIHYGTVANIPGFDRRGGFTESTQNRLTWDDSSVEENNTNWMADNANTSVDISATQAYHGSLAVRATRTGSTGTIQIRQKDFGPYYDVTPGDAYKFAVEGINPTAGRTTRFIVRFYDSNLTVVASATTSATVTTSWSRNQVNGTVPVGSVMAALFIEMDSVAVGEFAYFDMMYFAAPYVNVGGFGSTWSPGARTIEGPFTTVEYSEDNGTTWAELVTLDALQLDGTQTYYDYEGRSGVARVFRAYNWRVIDTRVFISNKSATSSPVTPALTNIWIHSDADPAGTAVNLRYDGTGRSDAPDNSATLTQFAGRTAPQVTFSEDVKRSVTFSAQLPDTAVADKLFDMAISKSTVVFRDQRRRRVRGPLAATFTDESYGQSVSGTVSMAGDQWDV
jgi:hypothetical protein